VPTSKKTENNAVKSYLPDQVARFPIGLGLKSLERFASMFFSVFGENRSCLSHGGNSKHKSRKKKRQAHIGIKLLLQVPPAKDGEAKIHASQTKAANRESPT